MDRGEASPNRRKWETEEADGGESAIFFFFFFKREATNSKVPGIK